MPEGILHLHFQFDRQPEIGPGGNGHARIHGKISQFLSIYPGFARCIFQTHPGFIRVVKMQVQGYDGIFEPQGGGFYIFNGLQFRLFKRTAGAETNQHQGQKGQEQDLFYHHLYLTAK